MGQYGEPGQREGHTVDEKARNEIIYRFHCGQSQREIARHLHVSRNTIRAVLDDYQQAREGSGTSTARVTQRSLKVGKLAAFEETILQLLSRYPDITVVELLNRLRNAGYEGSYTILREHVKQIRRSQHAADTEQLPSPGAQARVAFYPCLIEWRSIGPQQANLFVYHLPYSGRSYVHFTAARDLATVLFEHTRAFALFNGVAVRAFYRGVPLFYSAATDAPPQCHPIFLSFASHYGFRPESLSELHDDDSSDALLINAVRKQVLQHKRYQSLDHANSVLFEWLQEFEAASDWQGERRQDRFAREQAHLIPLPRQSWNG